MTEEFDIKTLNIVDFFYLILFIRLKSTGEITEGTLECSKCKKQTEFEFNLEEAIKIKNKEEVSKTVHVNKELSLRLIPSNIRTLIAKKDLDVIDIVSSSIDAVIYNKKIFKDFSEEELQENILNVLTKKDFDIISKGLEKLAKLYIAFDYICIHCGEINKYETDDILNFQ